MMFKYPFSDSDNKNFHTIFQLSDTIKPCTIKMNKTKKHTGFIISDFSELKQCIASPFFLALKYYVQ